VEPLSIL